MLFTKEGILSYAKDALKRMVNPFLNDPIERITRDPVRKLGWEDRLIGAMRLALDAGVQPLLLAEGARIALQRGANDASLAPKDLLKKIWSQEAPKEELNQIAKLLID